MFYSNENFDFLGYIFENPGIMSNSPIFIPRSSPDLCKISIFPFFYSSSFSLLLKYIFLNSPNFVPQSLILLCFHE